MRIADTIALSSFVRRTAESVWYCTGAIRNLIEDVCDSYRPELHYMRGPGPKWRAKHRSGLRVLKIAPRAHEPKMPPAYVSRRRTDRVER
jgi:hypothetical protein